MNGVTVSRPTTFSTSFSTDGGGDTDYVDETIWIATPPPLTTTSYTQGYFSQTIAINTLQR